MAPGPNSSNPHFLCHLCILVVFPRMSCNTLEYILPLLFPVFVRNGSFRQHSTHREPTPQESQHDFTHPKILDNGIRSVSYPRVVFQQFSVSLWQDKRNEKDSSLEHQIVAKMASFRKSGHTQGIGEPAWQHLFSTWAVQAIT